MPDAEQLTAKELIDLGAVDSLFFARTFFPNAIRQESPPFHAEMWRHLEDPTARFVNLQVFRGGAKTTTLRIYTAKRIAYGLAHTILYIGKSEGHAIRSVAWLRTQIEYNRRLTHIFNLSRGKKWQDSEAEIWHGTDKYPVWIMGLGITGSVRGVLHDDFRPDLIVLDDVVIEENSATPEQREKISSLVYGALKESLAPASEAPDAKMVMLQTPLNREDVSTLALADSEWRSARYGCWTSETVDKPLHEQQSIWPTRWPSSILRKEKEQAIARNRLSLWMREKECRIVSPETSSFRPDWLKYYDLPPERLTSVVAIDPVPPPSEIQVAKGMHGKDYEALVAVGRSGPDFYLLEYRLNRGHEPNWTVAQFFELANRHKPRKIIVESTAYQRTLAWLLRKAMEHQRRYWVIEEFDDRRKKFDRILDGLSGPASNGHFYVKKEHTEFIQQFTEYPDVVHDDLIEAVAVATSALSELGYADDEGDMAEIYADEKNIPALEYLGGCP